jgi:hypothetical protein
MKSVQVPVPRRVQKRLIRKLVENKKEDKQDTIYKKGMNLAPVNRLQPKFQVSVFKNSTKPVSPELLKKVVGENDVVLSYDKTRNEWSQ